VSWRCQQIRTLCLTLQQNAKLISEAQLADHVTPSDFTGSGGMMMGGMGFYLSKVGEWAAPTALEDTIPPERSGGIDCDWLQVKEPKGIVLNIAPWNAPVLLSVLPILGALAAGNCCVIKPPDSTPKTSALLKELIAANLPSEAVFVVEGGADVVNGLIDLGFDHIFFTGGAAIGKLIMARAAQHLTPVTLELGGKNPVMIDEMDDQFMAAAVKEIVGTKAFFGGEFCQCHDYILVLDSMWDKFTQALGKAIEELGDRRYIRLIHERHYSKVKKMMTDHHGTCLPPDPVIDDAALKLPVTAILEPRVEDLVMQDEVFGPCWAVLKVSSIDEAMARVASTPPGKPLVSYYYGQGRENAEKWMKNTSSGSLAINAGSMRLQANYNAGIYGVGSSGLGGAGLWGQHVFDTFSHHKHVVHPRGDAFAGSIWGCGPYKGTPSTSATPADPGAHFH